jgi:hypothetical protein
MAPVKYKNRENLIVNLKNLKSILLKYRYQKKPHPNKECL